MVIDHILRSYDSNEHGGTYWDKLILGIVYLKSLVTSFWLSSLLIISGIVLSLRFRWPYRYPFLIAALTPSFGLILILNIPSGPVFQSYLFDFSVPSFLFMSFFLAFGLNTFFLRYAKSSAVSISILIILLLTQVGINFRFSSHHNDRLADIWGTELLKSLKPNSILILCASSQFHLAYLQLIKGLREDVTIYDRFSLWTPENLFAPALLFKMQGNPVEYRRNRELDLISNSTRPIYYTCKEVPEELGTPYTFTPFVIRVDKSHSQASALANFTISNRLLESFIHGYPKTEFWLDLRRRLVFSRLISYFGGHHRTETHRIIDYLKRSKYYSEPNFIRSLANDLYFYKNFALAKSFYEQADRLSSSSLTLTDLAVYCSLLANSGNYDKALAICRRQERASSPCAVNTVNTRQTIAAIYKGKSKWFKVVQYSRKILECQPDHKVARDYLALALQRIETGQPATELIANDETK
jgi:tetratricopeptide (TPR) repeat protein